MESIRSISPSHWHSETVRHRGELGTSVNPGVPQAKGTWKNTTVQV